MAAPFFPGMASASYSRTRRAKIRIGIFLPIASSRWWKAQAGPWDATLFPGRSGFRHDATPTRSDSAIRRRGSHLGHFRRRTPVRLPSRPMVGFLRLPATRTGDAAPSVTLWKTPPLTEVAKLPGIASRTDLFAGQPDPGRHSLRQVVLWDIHSAGCACHVKPPQPGAELHLLEAVAQ